MSQGGLINILRRAETRFETGREAALAALRKAEVVASDETGVRIEGSNSFHWVFRCEQAVVHHAAPADYWKTPRAGMTKATDTFVMFASFDDERRVQPGSNQFMHEPVFIGVASYRTACCSQDISASAAMGRRL